MSKRKVLLKQDVPSCFQRTFPQDPLESGLSRNKTARLVRVKKSSDGSG